MCLQVGHADTGGHNALCHSVIGGHLEVVKYMSNSSWATDPATADSAIQAAFVLSAGEGHTDIAMFLLEKLQESVSCHIDSHDQLTGETGACFTLYV